MFKVGDIVEITEESSATGLLDFIDGKGVVKTSYHYDQSCPVKVVFEDGDYDFYTDDGKLEPEDKSRRLYFSEPKIEAATEPLFEPVLKENDMVYAVHTAGYGDVFSIAQELEHEVKTHCGEILVKTVWDFYRIGEKIEFN